jgi:hypothetical protein
MKLQSFFVPKFFLFLAAAGLAFSLAAPGLVLAAPLLGKVGLPKPGTVAVAADVPATTNQPAAPAAVVEQPVVAEPAAPVEQVALVEQPVVVDPQSELNTFAASVIDGRANVLRGVYVPGVLALRVVQQSGAFSVNMTPGLATQFSAASAYGVTGLLADNVASGVQFYSLAPGQVVTLIYGDGAQRRYVVDGIARYQALSPTDPYSEFLDLASGARLSATDLFAQMYSGGDKVTFQTCLAQDGLMSWGRLFVTAHPAP